MESGAYSVKDVSRRMANYVPTRTYLLICCIFFVRTQRIEDCVCVQSGCNDARKLQRARVGLLISQQMPGD